MKKNNTVFKLYSDKEVMCLVCKNYVSNHSHCIKTHVNGKKHQSLICNSIRVRDDEIYCRLCDITIDDTSIVCLDTLKSHLKQYCHVTALEEIENLIEADFLMMPEDSNYYDILCTICDCSIPFKFDDISNHINGHRHRGNRSMAVKPLNGIIAVQDDDEQLWCKVCKSYFPNYVDDILDHVDDDDEHEEILNEIEEIIEDEDISIEDFLNNNKDKAFCQRCSVYIPFCYSNIEEHINGYRHCK